MTQFQLLKQAQRSMRRGDKATARALLARVVRRNPNIQIAWLWLSTLADEPAQEAYYLDQVLKINPDHMTAQRRWANLVAAQEPRRRSPRQTKAANASGIQRLLPWLSPQAEALQWYEWLWAGLPLVLIILGGAIGGGLGGLAVAINVTIFRSGIKSFSKYVWSGVISVTVVMGYLISASLLLLFIQ